MTRHFPPAGQTLIGVHTMSAECPCRPTKVTKNVGRSSGRYGSHQGYRVEVSYQHKLLETA